MRCSMNMQMSPASTHSLRDPLVDHTVCDVRNTSDTSDFKPCFWDCLCLFHCSFKEEILSNAVDLWTYTWCVL